MPPPPRYQERGLALGEGSLANIKATNPQIAWLEEEDGLRTEETSHMQRHILGKGQPRAHPRPLNVPVGAHQGVPLVRRDGIWQIPQQIALPPRVPAARHGCPLRDNMDEPGGGPPRLIAAVAIVAPPHPRYGEGVRW